MVGPDLIAKVSGWSVASKMYDIYVYICTHAPCVDLFLPTFTMKNQSNVDNIPYIV